MGLAEDIKVRPSIQLKPSKHFSQVDLPYLYQKRQILISLMRSRHVVGDDVGLGKTLESLVTFAYKKAQFPDLRALVLTERIAYRQWWDAIHDFLDDVTVSIVTTGTYPVPAERVRAYRQHGRDILVTGYGQLYRYTSYMLEGMGDNWMLIADEPNYFKNEDTLLYRNIKGIAVGDIHRKPYRMVREKDSVTGRNEYRQLPIQGSVCSKAMGLTATVVENKLEEAYSIFSIIAPGCFQSKRQFYEDYCVRRKIPRRKIYVTTGYKNLDKFREQIRPYFYGRLQDDPEVEQELPEVIVKDLQIEMSIPQSRKLMEAMDRIIEMPEGEIKQLQILPSLIMAQQIADDPRVAGFPIESEKTASLMETVVNSLAGERILIFSKLRRVIDQLEKEFDSAGLETVRITGKEDDSQRQLAKQKFMSDGDNRVNILLGTRAVMKAVDLYKGAHLFFFDLPWSYGWYRQVIGRLRRTGSTQTRIGVYRMLSCIHQSLVPTVGTEKTIDHYTLETIKRKYKLWQAITGDTLEIEGATSDIMDIFDAIRKGYKS